MLVWPLGRDCRAQRSKHLVCLFDSKVTSNLPVFWGDPPSEPWSVHQSHVCKLHIGLPVYYTGQKPINSPCISVNLRHSEEPWDNRISALLSCLHGIVTWRIYGVLSGRYEFRFCECPQNPLFSHPNYSVLHNNWRSKTLRSKTLQGAVISRDCCQYLEVVQKIVVIGIHSLETNYDHRLSVIDDRRDPGMNEIFCAYYVLNFSYKLAWYVNNNV